MYMSHVLKKTAIILIDMLLAVYLLLAVTDPGGCCQGFPECR